jgi:hypothetical protein
MEEVMIYKSITFKDALKISKGSHRSLLLGNGFSISIWDKFDYKYLYQEANNPTSNWARATGDNLDNLFTSLQTHDFEKILAHLNIAIKVARCYHDESFEKKLIADKQELINSFIAALHEVHPQYKSHINSMNWIHLVDFITKFDEVYTVNYDLLLYWVINQPYMDFSSSRDISKDPRYHLKDGFGGRSNITWKGTIEKIAEQNVYYLHGCLFFYLDEHNILSKLTNQACATIPQQIRKYLESGKKPLIVLEGKYEEKLDIIRSSPYLHHAFESFGNLSGNLFIFGFSLNEHSDKHLIDQIQNSNVKNIFLGNHNSTEDELNEKSNLLTTTTHSKKKRNIFVFNSNEASNWFLSTKL